MKILKLAFLFAGVLALSPIAQAQSTLVGWNFNSNTAWVATAPAGTVQTVDSNVTLTQNWTWGAGVAGSNSPGAGAWGANNWSGPSDLQGAVTAGNYVSFSVTADTGYSLSFSSIDPYNVRRSSSGPSTGQWQYSIDGTNFVNIGSAISWGNNTTSSGNSQSAINLSGIANLQNIAGGTTVTFRVVNWGASGDTGTWYFNSNNAASNPNLVFKGTAAIAENNTSVITAPTTASVGRVMQNSSTTTNVSVTRTGTGDADFSTTTDNAIAPATGTITGGSGSVAVGVDTSVTGNQEGTVTFANESNPDDTAPNKTVTVTGTVVADREIDGSVNVGKVFVGTSVSGTATLTTTGDSDHFTTVTVNGDAVVQGDASVAAGVTTTFDDASDTVSREITGTFGQSGNGQSLSVDLNVTGEGLAGENAGATATLQADVYQHALLVANDSATLGNNGVATVFNEYTDDFGQRAAAVISSKTVTGSGWSAGDFVDDLSGEATNVFGEGTSAAAAVSFDSTNKLNGSHVGSLVVGFEDEAGIAGGGSLGSKSWALSANVSGNTAQTGVAQTATVLAGNSFAGFDTTHTSGLATQIALRAGTAVSTANVEVTFSDIGAGALSGVANDATRVSDIVSLEGTGSNVIVLQLSYNDAGITDESSVALFWLAGGAEEWTLATAGNTGAGALAGAYEMSYDAFLAANGGVFDGVAMLGAYGVDTAGNTTWAVINHNSDFAVNVVPEPGTVALFAIGGAFLCGIRRRYQARA
jgi:hypothetical protein